jgi:hypothetical protein
MGWVQEKMAARKRVRGIIVAADCEERLKYASLTVPAVQLKKYRVNFAFEDI